MSVTNPLALLTSALGLPEGCTVTAVEQQEEVLIVLADWITEPGLCRCGQHAWNAAGWSGRRRLRGLPVGCLMTSVQVRVRVFQCRVCRKRAGRPSAQVVGSLLPSLEAAVVEDALTLPVEHVARRWGLTRAVVSRVVDATLAARLAALPRPAPRHLGIDGVRVDGETRLAFVDGDTGRYIAIHENERPATVRRALKGLVTSPAVVSMDLSGTFREAVRVVFPGAVRVADRYHVVQAVNAVFDRYRASVSAEADTRPLRTKGQRARRLAQTLPARGLGELAAAWDWRNALDGVWEKSEPAAARVALEEWAAACPPGIRPTAEGLLCTLLDWREEISNHAAGSNARTEAANRRARYWVLVAAALSWERVAARLILAPTAEELDARHARRRAALVAAGASTLNARSASSPPPQQTSWTRSERRKRALAKGPLVRSVMLGGP